MTLSYNFTKPSAENTQLCWKSLLSNKLSRINIAKLVSFLTENENLIKQPPDATSSSDSDPDFSPSTGPQTYGLRASRGSIRRTLISPPTSVLALERPRMGPVVWNWFHNRDTIIRNNLNHRARFRRLFPAGSLSPLERPDNAAKTFMQVTFEIEEILEISGHPIQTDSQGKGKKGAYGEVWERVHLERTKNSL
ncbi:hypothetical protein AVEN_171363-1 [Araneus ventricosus]|uniref:Uncharacterized protein n=1 Tax=Araneus ventricosus TaxID=182803 RepID=A0A4Y2JXB1_ARAVE|nr:hypothetical protein AVEN_171363-1 [Araneus ventricosus]